MAAFSFISQRINASLMSKICTLIAILVPSPQVKQMHVSGQLLALVVPVVLFVMNMMWFWKIFKGMKKTLAKRH
jgi:hypothetical protein